jgi:hypothetical protein
VGAEYLGCGFSFAGLLFCFPAGPECFFLLTPRLRPDWRPGLRPGLFSFATLGLGFGGVGVGVTDIMVRMP